MNNGRSQRLRPYVCSALIIFSSQLHLSYAESCGIASGTPSPGVISMNNERLNVLGSKLQQCGCTPMTGFFRDGFCRTDERDFGSHTVCAIVSEQFLTFTKSQGNDLSSPAPNYGFPGLKPGDKWCLCVRRWKDAYEAGVAPKVVLEATDASALKVVTLEQLMEHSVQ